MKIDAVFEGGGVRGVAFCGAIEVVERAGYEWHQVAGNSAGAVVASLLAAGYRAAEINDIMNSMDYEKVRGQSLLDQVPVLGKQISLLMNEGIYTNEYLESWLGDFLAKKGVRTFGDLPDGKLKIIASDLTNGRMMVLPDDLEEHYGVSPQEMTVAKAVRMSSSLPFFFEPVLWNTPKHPHPCYIVDGGILSNFPLWLFDTPEEADHPTFGFRLVRSEIESKPAEINGPFTLYKAMFKTMLQAHDLRYLEGEAFYRTIMIETGHVTTTQFDLDQADRDFLYQNGIQAAEAFLKRWDFEAYKAKYGAVPDPAYLAQGRTGDEMHPH